MKKFLMLSLLAGLFTLISTTTTTAQTITNTTNCDIAVRVAWGFSGCTYLGFVSINTLGSGNSVTIPLPLGATILLAQGTYTNTGGTIATNCIFSVGQPCSGFGFFSNMNCITSSAAACTSIGAFLFGGNVTVF